MADADEIGEVFANAAMEGNDELEDELEDLMADMEKDAIQDDFGDVIIPGTSIAGST